MRVCRDLDEKKRKTERLEEIGAAIEKIEKELNQLREVIQEKNQLIVSITALLDKDKNSYQNYRDAKEGHLLDEDIEKLESRRNVLIANTSGKLQDLQDILADYRQRRGEKKKELLELQLEEGFDVGKEFRAIELNSLLTDIQESNQKLKLMQEEKNQQQLSMAEKNSDLRYVEKNILEQCVYEKPKEKSYIRQLNFEIERESLLSNKRDLEKQITGIKTLEASLQRLIFSLGEYEVFVSMVSSPFDIKEDLSSYISGLIQNYKEYESHIVDCRNELASCYQKLETEFIGKAEMFKGLFQSILEGEKRYQPVHALNAINRVYLQIERKLEQHSIDLKKIDEMERCIIDNTLNYLKNVYDEMNGLDRNSTIEVGGRRCKMLLIELPEKNLKDKGMEHVKVDHSLVGFLHKLTKIRRFPFRRRHLFIKFFVIINR